MARILLGNGFRAPAIDRPMPTDDRMNEDVRMFGRLNGLAPAVLLAVGMATLGAPADASPISVTTEPFTTGTPCDGGGGGFDIFQCETATVSNLMVGDGFDLTWFLTAGDETVRATGMITLEALSPGLATLLVMLENNDDSTGNLTSFAFTTGAVAIGAATVSDAGGGDDVDKLSNTAIDVNFVGNFHTDVCIYDVSRSGKCGPGAPGNSGLAIGDLDAFLVDLTPAALFSFGDTLSLDSFLIKFQTDTVSVEIPALVAAKSSHAVPEPGTLAILGAGLLGLGLVRRRRKIR